MVTSHRRPRPSEGLHGWKKAKNARAKTVMSRPSRAATDKIKEGWDKGNVFCHDDNGQGQSRNALLGWGSRFSKVRSQICNVRI